MNAIHISLTSLALLFPCSLFAQMPTWVGTWQSSPAGLPTLKNIGTYVVPPRILSRGTFRYHLIISQGGTSIRLRFSNEYGEAPLTINAASVGLGVAGKDIKPGSLRRVTFGGSAETTIPSGAPALSDAIAMPVDDFTELVVSVYVAKGIPALACDGDTNKPGATEAEPKDETLSEHPTKNPCDGRPMLTEVDVTPTEPTAAIVALGDSITNNFQKGSTTERSWTSLLARRIEARRLSVVNAGISGNRLTQNFDWCGASAQSRMDRDVLSVPNVKFLIVFEGVNDLGMSGKGAMMGDLPVIKPEEMIAAYLQIIARAHEKGIKVFGATITPFKDAQEDGDYYTEEKEQVRKAVNQWIRTSSAFDQVIDFDAALRDPLHPESLSPKYDAGDHLHPSAAGFEKLGETIDLRIFQ